MLTIRALKPVGLPYKVVGSNLRTNAFEITYTIHAAQFKNISITTVKDWEMTNAFEITYTIHATQFKNISITMVKDWGTLAKQIAVKGNAILHLREMKVS